MAGHAINHLDRLPFELKIMVVDLATSDLEGPPIFVPRCDIKLKRDALGKIRGMIRSLKDAASAILFQEITFRARMTAAEWSANPFTCGLYVKTLNMVTIEYEAFNFSNPDPRLP